MYYAQFYLVFDQFSPFIKYFNLNLLTWERKYKIAYYAKNVQTDFKIFLSHANPVAKFWHRVVVPARQATQASGPVQQLYAGFAGVNYILQLGTLNLATTVLARMTLSL